MNARRWLGLSGLLVMLALGCTGGTKFPAGIIKGKVTRNGQPVAAGTLVQFRETRGAAAGR